MCDDDEIFESSDSRPFIEIISESTKEQSTKHVSFVEGTAEGKVLKPLAVLDSDEEYYTETECFKGKRIQDFNAIMKSAQSISNACVLLNLDGLQKWTLLAKEQ